MWRTSRLSLPSLNDVFLQLTGRELSSNLTQLAHFFRRAHKSIDSALQFPFEPATQPAQQASAQLQSPLSAPDPCSSALSQQVSAEHSQIRNRIPRRFQHLRSASSVNCQHLYAKRSRRLHRSCNCVRNIVQLQIQKDRVTALLELFHNLRSSSNVKLQTNLEPFHRAFKPLSKRERRMSRQGSRAPQSVEILLGPRYNPYFNLTQSELSMNCRIVPADLQTNLARHQLSSN